MVRWVVAEEILVEVEVEFMYNGIDVVVLDDVKDEAAPDVDVEPLDNEVVEVPVEAEVLLTDDPVEADVTDDEIVKNGEKFVWVVSASFIISIV